MDMDHIGFNLVYNIQKYLYIGIWLQHVKDALFNFGNLPAFIPANGVVHGVAQFKRLHSGIVIKYDGQFNFSLYVFFQRLHPAKAHVAIVQMLVG